MLSEMYYWMIFYLKKVKTNDMPEFNSFLIVSLMVFFNIATIFIIAKYIFDISIKLSHNETTLVGVGSGLFVGFICYLFTYRQKKEILEKYDNLPKNRRIKGIVIFWIYVTLSFSLLFIAGVNLIR
jgi:hypothetical protein